MVNVASSFISYVVGLVRNTYICTVVPLTRTSKTLNKGKMETRKELEQKLREGFGGDEYPVIKEVKISELTMAQLKAMLIERDFPVEEPDDRQYFEDLLRAAMDGSDEVVLVEMIDIELLSDYQLQEALIKVSEPAKTIRDIQQELAENCGFEDDIIWDFLLKKDAKYMKDKIKQLIPDQKEGQNAIEKMRNDIFNNLWAQRKYTNGNSFTYIFYVMVTKENDLAVAENSTNFSCHPVFRCRKCTRNDDSSECCMIYVDETGRVYQNWKSFVEDNVLPAGTMIAPRRGVYNFDRNKKVLLDAYCTPNGKLGSKIMNVAQTSSAVLGIGAACVPVAAAVTATVAAPVVAAAGVVGIGVGIFSAVTSALNLSDRAKHEQSISVTDSQARASYLGIAGGVIGVAAAGATRLMTTMASAGRATAGLEILVNGINISTIVLSGSGIANGVLDLIFKYQDNDKISALDVLQLSASLALFTHSVYNFQLASQIANEARNNSIKSYRETLSNRQRKIFDKMSKETMRISGESNGKMDIIRNINKIPDRQYLNDLFKINKNLNEAKVRPAFSSSGEGIVLNNEVAVDTGSLRASVQHQQGPNILEQVTNPIPPTHNGVDTARTQPAGLMLFAGTGRNVQLQDILNEQTNSHRGLKDMLKGISISLVNGAIFQLGHCTETFLGKIQDGQKFEDVILCMASNLPEDTFRFLLQLSQEFMERMLEEIMYSLKMSIPTESVLFRILKTVLRNYQNLSYDYISTKGDEILNNIRQYFVSLYSINTENQLSTKCKDCEGYYTVCNI